MFNHILAPVDLAHLDRLKRALEVTGDLARHYGVPVTYVGVTTPQPGPVAHSPEEFTAKLADFASGEAAKYGHDARSKAMISHDPAIDLDHVLHEARQEIGADLVLMGSHMPALRDYLWPSHGGKLALHGHSSVFLVREDDG
ncbi:universal stress protein [Rhodovulum adriaticum]|uniref:Nucleotide-binding universal stress UspA family protein n=1 Tax=Rhodovulum adriaticum TaxID=35804 RepID=A0A4R2NPF7_RHOAD|nr:universal stress protein [Rhodovulum adriaticum]MBK1634427.1 universal stress protein UspA [Rhodovulum adriaticum]TCP23204.1 nucleotide-binding universal stress UspA family protein [Rhodovulum adriaticum]